MAKLTNVEGEETPQTNNGDVFTPSEEIREK